MKSILSKIYFHPLFVISTLIFALMGYFRFMTYFMLLIMVHELGHILISLIFNWNIDKIIILPFGGLTKFNEIINRPLIEEFLISISGIIFQMFFFVLAKGYITYKYFSSINYFIIVFNLIPIYPLDGSKILNCFFNIITSFKNSIFLTSIVSYTFIILLIVLLFRINKLLVVILVFLFVETNKLYKKRKNLLNKFFLERYLYDIKFKKRKTINDIHKMKRDYTHIIYINGKYITERFFLKKMFDINNNL